MRGPQAALIAILRDAAFGRSSDEERRHRRPYSTLISAALISGHHLAISAF